MLPSTICSAASPCESARKYGVASGGRRGQESSLPNRADGGVSTGASKADAHSLALCSHRPPAFPTRVCSYHLPLYPSSCSVRPQNPATERCAPPGNSDEIHPQLSWHLVGRQHSRPEAATAPLSSQPLVAIDCEQLLSSTPSPPWIVARPRESVG
eukprot:scaffold206199_cov30-Tisochrysis_lutea.AAC.2